MGWSIHFSLIHVVHGSSIKNGGVYLASFLEPLCRLVAKKRSSQSQSKRSAFLHLTDLHRQYFRLEGGGLNRSTQHFILNVEMEVLRWIEDFVVVSRPQRCRIAGSEESRRVRLVGPLARSHRPFIFRFRRMAVS